MNFKSFMSQVDDEMGSLVGLSHRCICDFGYRYAFDDELSPRETAIAALINEFGIKRLVDMANRQEIDLTVEEIYETV